MIENEYLIEALSRDISEEVFWKLNPRKLKLYVKAYDNKLKRIDNYVWNAVGTYVQSAVFVAVDRNLRGRKSKSEYEEKTIYQIAEEKAEENRPLTEEEIQRKREEFVTKMLAMKANFDANHKEGGGEQ
jgi:hypothetical protein